jgi:hypothetical protein
VTRYELLDRIGVGGMAEIFRGKAVAAGGFEKPVAIKRILPHLSQDTRFVELLIAEAKVLSLLKHRNIVQIFDVGLGDDGKYFLVMEYVDGKDLGAVQRALEARRRRMPFDLALHIGAEVCEALEHAHSARAPDSRPMALVHRDVSPSNVLLSRAGEVKLTDFGIAKRAEQEVTGHGSVRGKFAYISPEQARNEHLDPRSDVFSVAILLWELICNRRLFSGMGDLEALRAVRDAQVPRPHEIDPRLSPEIDALLVAALARDVKHRPTAGQFGAKLRSLRYSLEVTVGDPATELAKIIDDAVEVERQSQQMMAPVPPQLRGVEQHDPTEATVIRIRTADAFQMRDKDGGVARAREVIDKFEEEETRQAQLSGDQLRMLRQGRRGETDDLVPAPLPGMPRARRPTDEPTVARPPILSEEIATLSAQDPADLSSGPSFDSGESTRMVAPRDRRTPEPQRSLRPPSSPPPLPGTIHNRSVAPGLPPPLPARSHAPTPGNMPNLQTPTPSPLPPQPAAPLPPTPMMRPPQAPPMLPPKQVIVPPSPQLSPRPLPPPIQPPPMQPPPMQMPPPGMQGQPSVPPYGWNPNAPPPEMYDQRRMGRRASTPQVSGFGAAKRPTIQPWMLVVGALIMAGLAFFITRLLLHP